MPFVDWENERTHPTDAVRLRAIDYTGIRGVCAYVWTLNASSIKRIKLGNLVRNLLFINSNRTHVRRQKHASHVKSSAQTKLSSLHHLNNEQRTTTGKKTFDETLIYGRFWPTFEFMYHQNCNQSTRMREWFTRTNWCEYIQRHVWVFIKWLRAVTNNKCDMIFGNKNSLLLFEMGTLDSNGWRNNE